MTTISSKTKTRFKTYKSDAAPFFFYIDIFPPDSSGYEESHLSALVKSLKGNGKGLNLHLIIIIIVFLTFM